MHREVNPAPCHPDSLFGAQGMVAFRHLRANSGAGVPVPQRSLQCERVLQGGTEQCIHCENCRPILETASRSGSRRHRVGDRDPQSGGGKRFEIRLVCRWEESWTAIRAV